MSRSGQAPRNGLAKLLWEAGEEDDPQEIATSRQRYACPECGWTADLHWNQCQSCGRDEPIVAVEGGE